MAGAQVHHEQARLLALDRALDHLGGLALGELHAFGLGSLRLGDSGKELYNYFNLPSGQKTYKDRWEGDPEWFTWYETLEGERYPALDNETYEIVCR